ncbi:MAG TPA: HAD hydrolase-like protein [Candidatus Acidoferrales bacterium]|nr:HAD hydrolase-like protein [Candidatus Acidoferrales bacterium]
MRATPVQAAFFDISGTLGEMSDGKFVAFGSTCELLTVMCRVLSLRLGIITNVSNGMTTVKVKQMLIDAQILKFFDPYGFVTSLDAMAAKPSPHIYHYAAQQMGLMPSQCLYVGSEKDQVEGACAAGMIGILKSAP